MDINERLFGSPPGPDDLARWAASGAMALTGPPDGPPLAPPASLVPAVADISTLISTTTTRLGRGVAVDGLALLGERAAAAGLHRQGRRSCGGATELVPCADGWLALALARSGDAELLPAWIGGVDVADRIRAWTASELVESAIDLGLACARLGELSADEPPFQLIAGRHGLPRTELQDLVVVDLSALWAGPLCASVLTSAGARVVKVESLRRLDGARFGPPAFYDLLHAGQESVALDFHDAGDVATLHRLLERADVVIEASRPRALEQLGVDADALIAGGTVVWLSITGYGRAGAGGRRVAFGDDAAVAGGLIAGDAASPWFCADAIADPLTGLVGAALILDRLVTGGSWLVEVAMARVAAWCARLPAGEQSWSGEVAPPRARPARGTARAPGEDTDAVLQDLGIR